MVKTINLIKCGLSVLCVLGFLKPLLGTVPEKPNILFIFVDDLGKEWVSSFGAEGIETPNIDRLAETGLTLENFYSMPQCTPSRVTLFTGQYPFRHGWVNHWDVPRWGGGAHFDWRKNPGIALAMQSAGYKTAVAGKWQINDFRVQPEAMISHGFDDYCMWTGYETGNPASAERYWNPYIHTKEGSKTCEGRFGEDVFTKFLVNLKKDPEEKHNLLPTGDPEVRTVLEKLWKVVDQMPVKDNDPIYIPLPLKPWDVDVTVKSQEWKK